MQLSVNITAIFFFPLRVKMMMVKWCTGVGAETVRPRWVKQIRVGGQSLRLPAHKTHLECVQVLFGNSRIHHIYIFIAVVLVRCVWCCQFVVMHCTKPNLNHEAAHWRHCYMLSWLSSFTGDHISQAFMPESASQNSAMWLLHYINSAASQSGTRSL